ncbi:MAG TPA: LysR substrate-binding domain-containing protein [Candidatus Acidoferrum sp.]|nr:LysR substrate-binding domain-containing protein [Candidatus Acidoferrum sp.]
MNLRDWEYFVAVAEHKHFGRAAEACHVSQPTLSAQLKKLEQYLGVNLVERDSKRVWLTPVGQEMAVRARRLLNEAEGLKQLARSQHNPLAGDIRLGAFPTLAPYLLPQVLPRVKKKLPELRVFLVEEKTQTLLQQLLQGELDAALLALPVPANQFDAIPLYKEEFLLAVPAGHALARRKHITLDELQGQQLMLLEEGHCLREQALSVCQLAGAGENSAFRASSLETLQQMVVGGLGVTLVPAMAAKTNVDGIRYIKFEQPPVREIALVFRHSDWRLKLWQQLAQVLRAC